MAELSGARVLVTGAGGFIGSHLTRRLVADGANVHAMVRQVSTLLPVRLADLRGRVTFVEADVRDQSAVRRIAADVRPQHVFHLAAYTHVAKSWSRVDECIQTNVQGTANLLHAIEPVGYERFVNMGTSEIYGDVPVPFREDGPVQPISPYSVSKHAAEEYCAAVVQASGAPIVMLRPFNAYGPYQSPDRVISEIVARARRGEDLDMTSGRQTREFNYVEDLVDGIVRASTAPGVDGEIINLGSGEEISIRDLTREVLELMGDPISPRHGALPDRPTEIWRMVSDSTKARTLLGWAPRTPLRVGLERTIAWCTSELSGERTPFVPYDP